MLLAGVSRRLLLFWVRCFGCWVGTSVLDAVGVG